MTAARLCVVGPGGRMGASIIAAAAGRDDVVVRTALARDADPVVALAEVDAYIDFSSAAATAAIARAATAVRRPAIIGTTGLDAAAQTALTGLAEVAPVVIAANFSVGVNLLLGMVERAAKALGPTWDAEVVELHHKLKRDAPSGTALALAQAVASGHGRTYAEVACHSRDGDVGPRPSGEIGVMAVRGGDVVGEHTVYFFGQAERLEMSHRAADRRIFALGALHAARWVVGQPPGRYDMQDVLGLRG